MTSAPSAGRLLVDRYSLTEVFGNGPASVVWRAWDTEGNREVAVKELQLPRGLDDLESAVVLKRLRREALEAASFHHSGAVPVHEVFDGGPSGPTERGAQGPSGPTERGAQGTAVYVVMDVFAGPTLAQTVAESGPLTVEAAARLTAEVLDTLEAAHAAGLFHRGVSPNNVLWSENAPAQLTDFAVSASLLPGRDLGLSPFSAPEQTPTTGAGPAADLWSVGATLRFAVDGSPAAVTFRPLIDALLADDPAARPDVDRARRLLFEAVPEDASAPALATDTTPTDDPEPDTAEEVSPEAEGGVGSGSPSPAEQVQPSTAREPWFFAVPVEIVPGSELRLMDIEPDRPPPPPPRVMGTWRTIGITMMTVGLCCFMLVLLSTRGGRKAVRLTTESTLVPAGWFGYTDPQTGFSVSRPPEWQVNDLGTVTDFSDPVTGAVFRVDTTAPLDPSPHRTWQRVEKAFAAHNPDYKRVRLVETEFQGRPASIWEYQYIENGEREQVVQLGFYAGNRPMALRFQADAEDWKDHQGDLAAFESSFRTPR